MIYSIALVFKTIEAKSLMNSVQMGVRGKIGERHLKLLLLVIGLLLIPSFTRIIANTEFRVVPIGKKIIAYAPLFAGFAIILYVSLGFLGFADPYSIQLGAEISEARVHLYDAPWATLWPGFSIFLILICLFLLHEGLAKHSR